LGRLCFDHAENASEVCRSSVRPIVLVCVCRCIRPMNPVCRAWAQAIEASVANILGCHPSQLLMGSNPPGDISLAMASNDVARMKDKSAVRFAKIACVARVNRLCFVRRSICWAILLRGLRRIRGCYKAGLLGAHPIPHLSHGSQCVPRCNLCVCGCARPPQGCSGSVECLESCPRPEVARKRDTLSSCECTGARAYSGCCHIGAAFILGAGRTLCWATHQSLCARDESRSCQKSASLDCSVPFLAQVYPGTYTVDGLVGDTIIRLVHFRRWSEWLGRKATTSIDQHLQPLRAPICAARMMARQRLEFQKLRPCQNLSSST
jgi:hypothetical protein